jgi:hypothetical protein
MSIIGPCVYASTIEPIWESDEAKILYQFLFYLRLILFGGCCNPFIFLIRLDLYHIHHDVIYRVEMCVCPFWIRPIYHVVHYCTRFSFFFFFFFFTIFYFLSVWVWLLELIRYSESVFFFFRLCASSAELVVEKKPFFTLLWLLLSIPFLAGPCVREGSEPVRRKWPGRWRLDVAGWRELVAYWKQENEVNCVVSISSSRDQTKKARNHARFTWPSHNTHTQILPALYTNSRKQTTAWILNSPFFSQSPIFFLSMWHTHLLLLPIILFPSDLFLRLSSFFRSWFYFRFVT